MSIQFSEYRTSEQWVTQWVTTSAEDYYNSIFSFKIKELWINKF